jgi:hypothetical protein
VKRLEKLLPLIDGQLRVLRQVERFARLEKTVPRKAEFM